MALTLKVVSVQGASARFQWTVQVGRPGLRFPVLQGVRPVWLQVSLQQLGVRSVKNAPVQRSFYFLVPPLE